MKTCVNKSKFFIDELNAMIMEMKKEKERERKVVSGNNNIGNKCITC